MAARDIDDVLHTLSRTLEDAIQTDSRIGYFVALYLRVTWAVKRTIIAGDVFDDGERMVRFDTIFANRFFQALADHTVGARLPSPWAMALSALERDDLMVGQHLALSMNAHINLDLGLAAVELMAERGEPLHWLRDDFLRINDVLERLIRIVQVQLGQLSPVFDDVTALAPGLQASIYGALLDGLRDDAWEFARLVAAADDERERARLIDERADLIARASELILLPTDFGLLVDHIVYSENQKNVRHNIRILAE